MSANWPPWGRMKIRSIDSGSTPDHPSSDLGKIIEVEKRGRLFREATEQLPHVEYVERVTELLKFLAILGVAAGLCICGFSIWLVMVSTSNGSSKINIFGQIIETNSIGMAGIFLGTVLVGATLKQVFKFLETVVRK